MKKKEEEERRRRRRRRVKANFRSVLDQRQIKGAKGGGGGGTEERETKLD